MKKAVAFSALLTAMLLIAAPAAADNGNDGGGKSPDASDVAELVTGLLPSATAQTCQHPLVENPFAFLGDTLDYVLAPDGSFEGTDGDGWLLEGGSATLPGNDPFPLHAGDDDSVLGMPAGSSAVSAPMCVDLNYPHFRMVVNQIPNDRGKLKGRLRVETMYPNSPNPRWHRVDVVRPETADWEVSDFIDLEPARGGSEPGGRQVSLRFTVIGDGSFEIDDVYVDPRFRI